MAYFDGRGNLILEICLPTDTDWTDMKGLVSGVRDGAAEALYQVFETEELQGDLKFFGIWPENKSDYESRHMVEEVLAELQRERDKSL